MPEQPSTESAAPEAIPQKISKAEINDLPLGRYEGRIHIIATPAAEEHAVKMLLKESTLGFDTESRPSFKKGESYLPSLVQFATDSAVYLFQINRLNGIEGIKPVLESTEIKKVGVAIHDDIRKLNEISPYEAGGFFDISTCTKRLNIANTGLRSLAALFLKIRISKGAQVSNWAKKNLNNNQIVYAATDAWVSRELYLRASKCELEKQSQQENAE